MPPTVVRPFGGARDTLAEMAKAALGDRGERSIRVRRFTEWVIRDVWPKDYMGEILAIRAVCVQRSPFRSDVPLLHYVNDPRHVEMVKDPERIVEEIEAFGTSLVDCDDSSTFAATMCLVVGREVEFVALGFARKQLSHVGVRVREPKSGRLLWLDGVAGPREAEAAGRAVELSVLSLN